MVSFPSSAQKVREMEDAVNQCAENVSPLTAMTQSPWALLTALHQLVNSMRGYVTSRMEDGKTSPIVNIMEWSSSVAYVLNNSSTFSFSY